MSKKKRKYKGPKDENKELLDFASISFSPCRLFLPTNSRKLNGRAELVIGRQRVGYGIWLLVATETVSAALLLLRLQTAVSLEQNCSQFGGFFSPLLQANAAAVWLFFLRLRLLPSFKLANLNFLCQKEVYGIFYNILSILFHPLCYLTLQLRCETCLDNEFGTESKS